MFGTSSRKPPGAIVLIQVWTYVIQQSGRRKPRKICDRPPLSGKDVQYTKKYAACAYQHEFNIFLILSKTLIYIIMEADAINEYDQAPNPDENYYVHVDGHYREWYRANNGIEIPSVFVLPINRSLP